VAPLTAWAAWAALTLAVLQLLFIVCVLLAVARFWRRVEPEITPLLQMFAPPSVQAGRAAAGGDPEGVAVSPDPPARNPHDHLDAPH
jgi:hypothetical protein